MENNTSIPSPYVPGEPALNEVLRRSGAIFFFVQSALNDAPRDGGKEMPVK